MTGVPNFAQGAIHKKRSMKNPKQSLLTHLRASEAVGRSAL